MAHQTNHPEHRTYHSIDVRTSESDGHGIASPPTYPPDGPYGSTTNLNPAAEPQYPPRHVNFGSSGQNVPERFYASTNPSRATLSGDGHTKINEKRPTPQMSRHSSYAPDFLLAGENYDTRNATEAHLAFAEGDFVKSRWGRLYAYLLNLSIFTRWTLYIIPVAALLWIPGVVALTAAPNAQIWHVGLLWWSIWLTVMWVGWWAALAFSMMLPVFLRWTIGIAAVSTRHYIDWFVQLQRYIAFVAWSVAVWISFQPLINIRLSQETRQQFPESASTLSLILKILVALVLCAAVLLGEKFCIQLIAYKFHERTYADRVAEQKIQIKCLVILYAHSSDIPGRSDTLKDTPEAGKGPINPKKFLRGVLKGVRGVAEGATTALGNVASEITGTSTLQPSSPEAKVYTALTSANKTRLLARRLYYSFRQEGASALEFNDIARFFPNVEQAHVAFAIFDKDDNGDATREEIELACLDVHRELMSLSASMKDIDSAVSRLDNILMSLYFVVAALIIAVSLDASFQNLLTGAGTFILGLSWLIGASAGEVLSSIIFLFIKHPYDIGDTVEVSTATYTVKEIRLLSTVFVDGGGAAVQAPHSALTSLFIKNHRRSGPESESIELDVAYDTAFEKIEELRAKMLAFVTSRRRDFQPSFDVTVKDLPSQEQMTLSAVIKYKSNGHLGALKSKRRNMWMCALKTTLKEVGIFGPKGDPSAPAAPTQYTLVPWEEANPKNSEPKPDPGGMKEPVLPKTDYNFSDKNATLRDNADNIFGDDQEDLDMTNPRQAPSSRPSVAPPSVAPEGLRSRPHMQRQGTNEEFEMRPSASSTPR